MLPLLLPRELLPSLPPKLPRLLVLPELGGLNLPLEEPSKERLSGSALLLEPERALEEEPSNPLLLPLLKLRTVPAPSELLFPIEPAGALRIALPS